MELNGPPNNLVAARSWRLTSSDLTSHGVVTKARLLVHGLLLQRRNAAQEVLDGAETVLGLLAADQAVKGHGSTVQHEPNVVRLLLQRGEIRVLVQHRVELLEGGRKCRVAGARPHLRDEARAERRDLAQAEGPVRRSVVHITGEATLGGVFEVVQSESSDHRNDDVVVRHVEVERLVQGELRCVVIVRVVDAGVAGVDQLGFEPGRQLEHVSDALGPAGWGTESVVAVELHVDVVGEVAPLLLGEQGAEERVTEGGVLVSTEVLHGKHVEGGQVEVRWEEGGKTGHSVSGISGDEDLRGFITERSVST